MGERALHGEGDVDETSLKSLLIKSIRIEPGTRRGQCNEGGNDLGGEKRGNTIEKWSGKNHIGDK